MPDRDFLFALELSDERRFEAMIGELAGAVLAHVGYEASAIDELRGVMRKALTVGRARSGTRCDVRFHVHSGELQITVACAGAAEWRTTRPLP